MILLVRQDAMELELERRTEAGWTTETARGPDTLLRLDAFGLVCPLSELYRDTPVMSG